MNGIYKERPIGTQQWVKSGVDDDENICQIILMYLHEDVSTKLASGRTFYASDAKCLSMINVPINCNKFIDSYRL